MGVLWVPRTHRHLGGRTSKQAETVKCVLCSELRNGDSRGAQLGSAGGCGAVLVIAWYMLHKAIGTFVLETKREHLRNSEARVI